MTQHARAGRRQPAVLVLAILLLVVTSLAAAAAALRPRDEPVAAAEPTVLGAAATASPGATPTPTPTPTPDPDAEFSLVAAGDVLPHLPVLSSARSADGGYDFGPVLGPLDPWVQGADLALCHLEVPVTPPGTAPSGYPLFGTPPAIASSLRTQGWDGCSTASNHSVDRGFAGVTATLDALDAAGLGHVGTARTAGEQAQPQLYTLDRAGRTITVAHVAATYGTNGMPVDADKPWSVNRIDVPAMVAQATAARAGGADLVVASIHCCVEYRTEPTTEQVAIDQALADSGVFDLVIGHHAHVPQPVAHLSGGPRGEGMWVAYGLGNYVSNQDGACCSPNTDSGLLLTAHIEATGAFAAQRRPAGPARVTGVEWTPITVDRLGGHQVHALVDIPGGTGSLSTTQVADRLARVVSAAGTEAPQCTAPLTPRGPPPVVVPRAVSG
ncbi:CapA family protein [Cellulomonas humilata]|uniref:Poly-gamma-glutamate synthesis protein (Capsule biosynthesis protein) n=1 Tax=Cellulomonas humilata TaxID=144055 RepID=A0ABU0EGH0_9CELL|nr:CapA family protein [Cellulomonas humilata]MDQ0374367.1 poly-gamma-glutamate synthesis protein (capsule biosynthesis protein) [Cellulomonas humilata]